MMFTQPHNRRILPTNCLATLLDANSDDDDDGDKCNDVRQMQFDNKIKWRKKKRGGWVEEESTQIASYSTGQHRRFRQCFHVHMFVYQEH